MEDGERYTISELIHAYVVEKDCTSQMTSLEGKLELENTIIVMFQQTQKSGQLSMVDLGLVSDFPIVPFVLIGNGVLVHAHSEILCGAALPGAFFFFR